jgi:hypothetical protein
MYPHEGAAAMAHRRNAIFPPHLGEKTFPYYKALEAHLKELLGIEEHVNWQRVMEVVHCHRTHGIKYIEGISDEDYERIAEVSAWHWGVLYKVSCAYFPCDAGEEDVLNELKLVPIQDAILNKLAIGRFIHDLLADVKSAMGSAGAAIVTSSGIQSTCAVEEQCTKDKNIIVYSGHDSTLVPVLCAMGLYDGMPTRLSYGTMHVVLNHATFAVFLCRHLASVRVPSGFGVCLQRDRPFAAVRPRRVQQPGHAHVRRGGAGLVSARAVLDEDGGRRLLPRGICGGMSACREGGAGAAGEQ